MNMPKTRSVTCEIFGNSLFSPRFPRVFPAFFPRFSRVFPAFFPRLLNGQYWIRTSDPTRVMRVL